MIGAFVGALFFAAASSPLLMKKEDRKIVNERMRDVFFVIKRTFKCKSKLDTNRLLAVNEIFRSVSWEKRDCLVLNLP